MVVVFDVDGDDFGFEVKNENGLNVVNLNGLNGVEVDAEIGVLFGRFVTTAALVVAVVFGTVVVVVAVSVGLVNGTKVGNVFFVVISTFCCGTLLKQSSVCDDVV